jgi:predicted Rossmann-fold nucleotide-binding protein
MRRLAVFAGSAPALVPEHEAAAARVGRLLADNGITALTEGITSGLTVAFEGAMREAGGTVLVMARNPELVARAEGLLFLPQGIATLAEMFQLWEWRHPGDPERPTGLLNVGGYFTSLLRTETDAAVERCARETQRGMLIVDADPEALLRSMADYRPPETRRLQRQDDA